MSNKLAQMGNNMDERYSAAGVLRTQLNKVFPTHWSFMLGEMALYSFIILVLTGKAGRSYRGRAPMPA